MTQATQTAIRCAAVAGGRRGSGRGEALLTPDTVLCRCQRQRQCQGSAARQRPRHRRPWLTNPLPQGVPLAAAGGVPPRRQVCAVPAARGAAGAGRGRPRVLPSLRWGAVGGWAVGGPAGLAPKPSWGPSRGALARGPCGPHCSPLSRSAPSTPSPPNAVTHANGFVRARQDEAYGEIWISAGPRM